MSWGRGGAAAVANPLQMTLWSGRDHAPDWQVRISRRARRLSMRVFPGGRIEVVVPTGIGIPAVERFVSRHRDWAERRSRELLLQAPKAVERRPDSISLGCIDRTWRVEYRDGRSNRVEAVADDLLRVHTTTLTDRHVSQALVRWLNRQAASHLGERLEAIANDVGIDYARLSVRRQRTRWGSCSTAGTISLNMCLMFQRPEVVRYLIVHELCHRRHMNHSRRYWALVESFEPGWKALDADLLKGWRHVPAWVFP
ncbi:MAG TPA: SprT family zinc-dependent metalloprotease [Steroidobacteraceae bacterium]